MKNPQIFVTCFDLDSLESNNEPRFLTVRTESITDTRAVDLFQLLWCANQMRNSVSSSFNLRLSSTSTNERQFSMLFKGESWSDLRLGLNEMQMQTSVSSTQQ